MKRITFYFLLAYSLSLIAVASAANVAAVTVEEYACQAGYAWDVIINKCVAVNNVESGLIISGVTGPTALTVGQQGFWSINATAPTNSQLTYTVDWGEPRSCAVGYSCRCSSGPCTVSQSTPTFTHTYPVAGKFKPTFTVSGVRCSGGSCGIFTPVSSSSEVVVSQPATVAVTCKSGQMIGDINGDGRASATDLALIQNLLSGKTPMPQSICCIDVNKDGSFNSLDRTKLQSVVAGLDPSPGVCGTVTCKSGQMIGDINGDGRASATDLALIQNLLAGKTPMPQSICCIDVNKDSSFNSLDWTKLQRIVSGLDPSPGVCGLKTCSGTGCSSMVVGTSTSIQELFQAFTDLQKKVSELVNSTLER